MTDPFSIVTGTVGVLAPAIHWTRLLFEDLQNISDAPAVVEALKGDLLSVKMTLESLQGVTEAEWATLAGRGTPTASMSEQLQKYQITLNLVISTATLHCSIHSKPISRETKDAITEQEAEITRSIVTTDRQLATVDYQLNSLVSGRADDDEGTGEHEVMENERAAFQESLKLLKELKARNEAEARRVAKEEQKNLTQISFGNNNAGFQLGTNNGSISGITFCSRN
ncbi:hypothetical protein F5Y06DRAFT_297374 [Hypoxylon sp. FL0890]|nr:hypothetical protein F5Y06DRAFT_297374 [Hypoxylon sp. FL0890]